VQNSLLVTGGAGFIGTNFLLRWMEVKGRARVINLDKLTYAGNPQNLSALEGRPEYEFVHGDIGDRALVNDLLARWRPSAIVNFAAESHVDRSIHGPDAFVHTNVVGTFNLLEEVRAYWQALSSTERQNFRFLHISTDEVYGSLGVNDLAFSETTAYAPNSPYSASKAASDHLVRAYHHTYGLPTLTTNCSNNYGPYQFPEKLIPLMIHNALSGKPLPVYGDGKNIRDWLYVTDHCDAISLVLRRGTPGSTYNVGGRNEVQNIDVVRNLCQLLDEFQPQSPVTPHEKLITYVKDRPGHDRRYAIDCGKIEKELGWLPKESFASGLRKTVRWYLDHRDWVTNLTSGEYRKWINQNYGLRVVS